MIWAAALLAAAGPVTIDAEQLGEWTQDCELRDEQRAARVDLAEAERFADCLVTSEDTGPAEIDRGVAIYRLVFKVSQADAATAPTVGDLRYKVVRAYGINGDVRGVAREAEALGRFVDSDPAVRCGFFDRLAVEFEDWGQEAAAAALRDRFVLSACPRYVPRDGWVADVQGSHPDRWSDQERGAFYERWFGNQLTAMQEPSFGDPRVLDGLVLRYRLTVLPTFTPGFAARIDQSPNGTATLAWVILDGAGGYGPGSIADRGTELLTRRQLRKFVEVLGRANLSTLARSEPSEEPRVDPETGGTVMRMCVDGTTWLFEQASAEGRVFLKRSCLPDEAALRKLITETYRLLPEEPFEDVDD